MTTKKRSTNHKKSDLQSTADAELTQLRVRLNKKREYIAILELELFNTRVALHEFSVIYNEQITPLENRLRQLRRKLYEILEEQRDLGDEEPPDFSEPEEPEFTYKDKGDNGWRKIGEKKHKTHSPKLEEKIRKLFRELAKRFHPDLTSDPVEKKWREEVMTKVNQAYSNRDLKTLEALAEQPDRPAPSAMQTSEQEIAALKAELKRLDGVIAHLNTQLRDLIHTNETVRLMLDVSIARQRGQDLVAEMARDFQKEIARLEIEVERLES